MPLEATHIKCALDLKDVIGVSDVARYIVGTIYPDSRYISGVDRKLTHDKSMIELPFPDDDFKKGWAMHILCDRVGEEVRHALLPELFEGIVERGQGSEHWIIGTAIKIIEDIHIASTFDIQTYVEMFDYVENPNGESLEKIKEYNDIVRRMYFGKEVIQLKDAVELWTLFGVGDEYVDRITQKTNLFLKDTALVARIYSLYDEMVKVARQRI